MTDFLARLYPGDAAVLGTAVVLLQIAAVIGLAAGAARWLARGAAARHAVWLAALGCVLVSPIVAFAVGRLGLALLWIPLPGRPPVVEAQPDGAWAESATVPALETLPPTGAPRPEGGTREPPAARNLPPAAAPAEATVPPAPSRSDAGGAVAASVDPARPADAWRAVLGAASLAWAAGAVFLLLRLLHGRRVLTRWRRTARPADARRLAGVLDAVRSGLGVKNLPRLLISPLAVGPSAVGVLHPCVLLPEGLIESLDDHQLRDVLIHECAHVLRRDPLIGLLQRLAEALFWPHPLVHCLNRRLARAHEEVCDDYVLRAGDARAYARTLLTLAVGGVRLPLGTPGLFGSNWKLEDRVAGLLDPRRTPMTRVNPWTTAGLAAVLLAACLAGAAVRPAVPAGEKAAANKDKEADAAPDVSKASIEGVVVNEDGKPVAGAVVGVLRPMPERITDCTAADGSYRLVLDTAAVGNAVVVTASAEDGERQGIYEFQRTVLPRTAHARIVVKPSRKMTVSVTDAAKRPVEDAAVGVLDYSTLLAHAETDAHGMASLRLPRDARIVQVIALKPLVGFDYFENYRSWPGVIIDEPPAQVALTLDGARTLSVRAVDSADKPLPGVALVPWSVKKKGKQSYVNIGGAGAIKYVSARTDRDGLAAFEWIPPDLEEGVTVLYGGKEYSLPDAPYQDPKPPYNKLTAKLFRKSPISGKATLPDGKPAAGILLQIEGRGDTNFYFRSFVRTSADGAYSLLVYPNQSYMIAVIDEDWAAPSKTGVVVKEGEPREGLDFHLGKGTMLRGRVTVGPDHKPGAKATISLGEQGADIAKELGGMREKRESLFRWVETDADGRYAIRLGPGLYQFTGPLQQPWGEVTIKDEETIDKDFHVDRLERLTLLKGTVLTGGTDGKPVGKAIVHVEAYMSVGCEAVADDKGRFEMERKNNKALLYARNADGTQAALVAVGADDDEVKPVLVPAGKLTGRILDAAGKPAAGVTVECGLFLPGEGDPNARLDLRAETDDAGSFTVSGVVPGTRCSIFAYKGPKYSTQLKEVPSAPAESLDLGDLVFDLTP